VDIRQLEALLAVAEEGSFTAAADRLHTVQSNVSGHVHQLEAELGVQLLVRSRRGTVPTEFGVRVIDRARAIRSEIEALHKDLSMLQGLETGHATLGVVGTVSRSLVPALVVEMRRVAPGLSLRLTEGASERLAVDVAERVLASAVVTEPVADPRLVVEHLRDEDLVGLVPSSFALRVREPVLLATLAAHALILPPQGNPLRDEVDDAARAEHAELRVPIEVEGIRLIADLDPSRDSGAERSSGRAYRSDRAHAPAPARADHRARRTALTGRPGRARRSTRAGAQRELRMLTVRTPRCRARRAGPPGRRASRGCR
jgi:LysR family transcriptional regulator, nitrogen assimilation regulatory protein